MRYCVCTCVFTENLKVLLRVQGHPDHDGGVRAPRQKLPHDFVPLGQEVSSLQMARGNGLPKDCQKMDKSETLFNAHKMSLV